MIRYLLTILFSFTAFCAMAFEHGPTGTILDAGITDISCNFGVDTSDPSDDRITFSLNPTGNGLGSRYMVTSMAGTVSPVVATDYGIPTPFQLFGGSAGNGDVDIIITDMDDPTCTGTFTIADPGSCSPDCDIVSVDVNVTCNPGFFSYFITVTGNNTGATYNISGDDIQSNLSYNVENGPFGPFSVINTDFTLDVIDQISATCIETVPMDISPCVCSITSFNLSDLDCNASNTPAPDDDFVVFSLNATGDGVGGQYLITTLNPVIAVNPPTGTYDSPTAFTLSNGSANGQPMDIRITDIDDASCFLDTTILRPDFCSVVPCALQSANLMIGMCDDAGTPPDPTDDQFSFSIDPSGDGLAAQYDIIGDVDDSRSYGSRENFGPFLISNGPVNITIRDQDDASCTLPLTINPPASCACLPVTNLIDTSVCNGSSIIIAGETFDENKLTDTITILAGAANGCDSIIQVMASLEEPPVFNLDSLLCINDFLTVQGTIYNVDRPMGQEIISRNGICDSTVNINLSFFQEILFIDTVFCDMDAFLIINSVRYDIDNPSGQETLTGNSCDTLVNISLAYISPATSLIDGVFCDAQEFIINNTTYNSSNPSGTEVISQGATNGCDSIIEIDLTFTPSLTFNFDTTLCVGGSININGTIYDQSNSSGTEVISSGGGNTCDSVLLVQVGFEDLVIDDLVAFGPKCEGGANGFVVINTISPKPDLLRFSIDGVDYFNVGGPDSNAIYGLLARNYSFEFIDDRGCTAQASIEVPQRPNLLSLGGSLNLVPGEDRQINITTNLSPDTLTWNRPEILSCTDCLNPTIFAQDTNTILTLTVKEKSGCNTTESILITYAFPKEVYIPNSFTANNDNLNDYFTIYGDEDAISRIRTLAIFDRWGNRVFYKKDMTINDEEQGWDGTFGNSTRTDVYMYMTEVEFWDGSIRTYHGDVTVLQ